MAEFDQYSENYKEVLNSSVDFSGEDSSYFVNYKANYIVQLLGPDFKGKILDFGCGVGLLLEALAEKLPLAEVHGYDVSLESLAILASRLGRPVKTFSQIVDLDKDYAVVVVSNVLHHIPPSQRKTAFANLYESLGIGGQIIVVEHNPLNPLTQWVVKHCPFDDDAILLKMGETCERAKMAGFKILRKYFIVFFPKTMSWLRHLEAKLKWLCLGAQYVVVGQKEKNG